MTKAEFFMQYMLDRSHKAKTWSLAVFLSHANQFGDLTIEQAGRGFTVQFDDGSMWRSPNATKETKQ